MGKDRRKKIVRVWKSCLCFDLLLNQRGQNPPWADGVARDGTLGVFKGHNLRGERKSKEPRITKTKKNERTKEAAKQTDLSQPHDAMLRRDIGRLQHGPNQPMYGSDINNPAT